MPITDEQRAMLQLLLEGGQGYDDIGSLLGIAPDEVRGRARAALRDMGGSDPDAQVSLSDYLLGQADPIGRADAVRHLQGDPDANALAGRLVSQLRLLAPKADLPEIPAPRGRRRAAPGPAEPAITAAAAGAPEAQAPPPHPPAVRGPEGPGFAGRIAGAFSGLGRLSKRQTQAGVAIAAALILAIVAVLVVSGGGGDNGPECPTIDTSAVDQAGLPATTLSAPEGVEGNNGCAPVGQVVLTASQNQVIVQANASGLKPTASGETYVLWLYRSDQESTPIGQNPVDDSGTLNGAAPLAPQALVLLPAFKSIRVSLITQEQTAQIQQALRKQSKQPLAVTPFVGQTVLEGPVPQLPQPANGQGAAGGGAQQGGGGAAKGAGQSGAAK